MVEVTNSQGSDRQNITLYIANSIENEESGETEENEEVEENEQDN